MSDDLISRKALLEVIQSFRCSITGLRAGKGVFTQATDEYQKSILQIVEDQPAALASARHLVHYLSLVVGEAAEGGND